MNRKKRVLLLYISEHSGHHAASLAIEGAIRELNADADILNIDGFNYTNPILERVINRTYIGMIRRTPEIWDYLYDNPEVLKKVQRFRDLIHRYNSRKLKELLDKFQPDAIACTQAFPCGMVADFKKSYSLEIPVVAVITDYVAHSYWIFDSIDFYVVPSQETHDKLAKSGIDEKKIKIYGIPINRSFTKPADKPAIAKRLGVNSNSPVVLVMGGGQGLGPIKKMISSLFKSQLSLQVITVAGTNKRLFKSLAKLKPPSRCKLFVLGYVNNVHELMDISSVLVTKPGGITITEAISKGLPLVIINPLPGQEAKNTEFLLKSKLAYMATDERELPVILSNLLQKKEELKEIKERYKAFAKPNAARSIAELILALSENYAHLSSIQNSTGIGINPAG